MPATRHTTATPTITRAELIRRYTERQALEPSELETTLAELEARYQPVGFMLLECADMSSSRLGELTILPYGPRNTYQTVPTHPISPRGLASDMSTVVAICLAAPALSTWLSAV
jgi:hypothetical protein